MKLKTQVFSISCFLICIFLAGFISSVHAQVDSTLVDTNRIVMLFAGDIMGHDGQINGAFDPVTGKYNYEPTFRYVRDYLSQADIAVCNFEVTLAGPPYKGYPQFSSPDTLAVETMNAGFDILAMANNHALDGGAKGMKRTLNVIDSLKLMHLGTYRDSLERALNYPLVFEKNHIRIALLNYTYGTNGLKVSPPLIINRIDTAQMRADIEKAKLASPDFIIVFMHWGIEYERYENSDQLNRARLLIKYGADAVIGSHPHVVQPILYLQKEGDTVSRYPVVFSLGNFVSNQREQYKDGGIIAELHLTKVNHQSAIDSVCYMPYWVWRKNESNGKSTFFVLPVPKYEESPESYGLDNNDIFLLKRFADDTRKHLEGAKESVYYRKQKEPL
jgi:poly-gamma-glutamate capsule biosynthesis protein CapA/YwtB (metallophosphatase superfamily)